MNLTQDILKELSPLVQDSYQYILFRVMSYSHFMLKNFDVSYDYALRILDLSYEMKDNMQISRALLDVARIHKMVEDSYLAIDLLKRAIQLNPNNIVAISELCITYLELKDFESAECRLQRIEELFSDGEQEYSVIALNFIKIYYQIQKEDYEIADKLLVEIERELYNPNLTLINPLYFFLKGTVMFYSGEYEKGIEQLKNAIDLSRCYSRKNILINSLALRSLAYERTGDFKLAYEDKYAYNQLNNNLNNQLFNQRLSVLKKYYLRKENEIKNQQIIEKAVRLSTVSLMADNMIYEVTPYLHSIHLNVDTILFWNKRQPGVIPSLFLEEIKMIKESVIRTEQIIEQMKNYWNVPDDHTKYESISINKAIEKANIIISKQLDGNIQVYADLCPNDMFVYGNEILLEQIIVNLLNNAIQALLSVDKDNKQITITSKLVGDNVCIIVDDNAIGFLYDMFPKEDDFMSNKSSYGGMGLGLMIVKKFLDKFNGKIEFCNNSLGGARTQVLLPQKVIN
ncbi:MAG: ATP-binding protein [Candidatus Cloacimonadales bacterium]|nr:ATP-binding protein [Candidatus Cloacimonadota bacterium]MDX9976412.1 ATP-binding protein [Candidatus Cloacimonadales bacterium]